jgi:hypothetical protein
MVSLVGNITQHGKAEKDGELIVAETNGKIAFLHPDFERRAREFELC